MTSAFRRATIVFTTWNSATAFQVSLPERGSRFMRGGICSSSEASFIVSVHHKLRNTKTNKRMLQTLADPFSGVLETFAAPR